MNDESNDSSDVLRKSQSIESKRSLLSGTRSKRSQLFSCSISSIDKSDTKIIGDRSEIKKADFVVILDDTLFNESAFDELKENGKVIVCTKKISNAKRK